MNDEPRQPADAEERLARLRERADAEPPESWVPDRPGDEVAGQLVRYDRGTTAYGEQIIAVLRTNEGVERSVWLLHAVLRGEFAKLRPAPGEWLLIRYEGKRTSAGGTNYASYRVEVDREAEPLDWSVLAPEGEPDPRADLRVGAPTADPANAQPHSPSADEVPFDDVPF